MEVKLVFRFILSKNIISFLNKDNVKSSVMLISAMMLSTFLFFQVHLPFFPPRPQ
nr:MAG TPA: hypothetical protein [Caudoviricetes sp.]